MPHFHKEFKDLSTIIYGINSCMFTSYESDSVNAIFKETHNNQAQINDNKFLEKLKEITEKNPFEEDNRFPFRLLLLHHNVLPYDHLRKTLVRSGISLRRDKVMVKDKKKKTTLKDHNAFIRKLKDYRFNIILHGPILHAIEAHLH